VGTLRFDLNNLVEQKGSGAEEAEALYASIEKLDVVRRVAMLFRASALTPSTGHPRQEPGQG